MGCTFYEKIRSNLQSLLWIAGAMDSDASGSTPRADFFCQADRNWRHMQAGRTDQGEKKMRQEVQMVRQWSHQMYAPGAGEKSLRCPGSARRG